jgi:hypothetical protein
VRGVRCDVAAVSRWYGHSLAELLSVSGTKLDAQKVKREQSGFEWDLGF